MTPAENAATVRKSHAQAMEALAADVPAYSGPAIRAWEKELDAALAALLAQAETAEANDEEIARLEGALDQAHKDYDETKAERDAAEENAREERKARKAVEAVKSEEVAIARTNWTARLEVAEAERDQAIEGMNVWHDRATELLAERDAAVRERDTFKRGVNENARMVDEQRERAEAAERAAEQAQEALRRIAESQSLGDAAIARAALTGED